MRSQEGDGVKLLEGAFGHQVRFAGTGEEKEGESVGGGVADLGDISILV